MTATDIKDYPDADDLRHVNDAVRDAGTQLESAGKAVALFFRATSNAAKHEAVDGPPVTSGA